MATGLSTDITLWLKQDVMQFAETALKQQVGTQKQRVITEQAARSGGIEPDLEAMAVDGNRHATIGDIRATSKVVLDWNYLTEAVIKTVGYLRLHGPVLKGEWKNSIVCLINGHQQDPEEPIPSDTREATIAVTVPYARKLEVGRTQSGRAFSIQVPLHFVEHSMIKLRNQMRDLATFEFTYIDLAGAHINTSQAGTHRRDFRHGKARIASRRKDTTVRYPAIVIREIKALA